MSDKRSTTENGVYAPTRRMSRAGFLRAGAAVTAGALAGPTGILSACGGGQDAASSGAQAASLGEEPGDIRVFTWRGFEDKQLWRPYARRFPDKPPRFPAFIDSDDQALAKVRSGLRVDVTQPSVGHAESFVEIDVVQPWDMDRISVVGQLKSQLLTYGQINGKQYSIPTDFGFHAPMYRADLIEPREDSWGLIFDDRYAGKICWYDNAADMLVMTALYLGIDEPLDMSDDELDEVKQFLIEKKPIVRNITSSPTDVAADFQQGNLVAGTALSYVFAGLVDKDVDVVYMQPKEGRVAWSDGFLLMNGSENYFHAHEYVSAWLSSGSAQFELEAFGLVPLNRDVDLGEIDPKVVDQLGLDDVSSFEAPLAHFLGHVARRDAYGRAWNEVKAA